MTAGPGTAHLVALAVLAPAAAGLVGLPAGRRSKGLAVGCAVTGASVALIASLWLTVRTWSGGRPGGSVGLGRLDLGGPRSATGELSLTVNPTLALVTVAVTVVALAVQVYSSGYLVNHPAVAGPTDDQSAVANHPSSPVRYAPYAATVSLFTAAMLAVVLAADLFTLLIGWEVMGLCSYLLIGHHSERAAARRAAFQAFLVTRVGDIGFILGIVALFAIGWNHPTRPTFGIEAILARVVDPAATVPGWLVTVAGVGLVIGVIGKSAQFPLHGWLPDAMEGPTPVSALIHAATMVAAGVVVLVRFGPLLTAAPGGLLLLAVVSCLTMIGAAVAAFAADDLKRVLAWSTVSQVAVMLSAVSLGTAAGRSGAIAHLLSHAAFKSLLFLLAGMIAVQCGTTALGGIADLRRRSRLLTVALAVGLGSLAALPPLTGFVSKEGVFTAAEQVVVVHARGPAPWVGPVVLGSLAITTVLTAGYAARLYCSLTRFDLSAAAASPVVVPVPVSVPMSVSVVEPVPAAPTPEPTPEPDVSPESDGYQPTARLARPWPLPPEPAPEPADRDDTLGFYDKDGSYQDWDLIADLDTAAPLPARPGDPPRRRRGRLARAVRAGREGQRGSRVRFTGATRATGAPTGPGGLRGPSDPGVAVPLSDADGFGQHWSATPMGRADQLAPPTPRAAQPSPAQPVTAPAPPGPPVQPIRPAPTVMVVTVAALTVVTLLVTVLPLLRPAGLADVTFGWVTALAGTGLSVAGAALGFLRGPAGHRDVATWVPDRLRLVAADGFGYQWAQRVLVIVPVNALARLISTADDTVIGTYVAAPGLILPALGRLARRVQTGVTTGYLSWLTGAAVAVGVAALLVGGRLG